MVFKSRVWSAPLPQPAAVLLLVLMTSLVSANPTPPPPSASSAHLAVEHREGDDQRDGRVWDMLREESRSFISAILPDRVAARTHDVLWAAPLHERAVREERIPRYTVVAMAGPPMLQSHDTELLDAALEPSVAGEFGRKANDLSGGRRVLATFGGEDAGRYRPEMMKETELMPNLLNTDGGHDVGGAEEAQAMMGHFGERDSSRRRETATVVEEAAPSAEGIGRGSTGAVPPADIISGFSSIPQTERVPYVQNIRDFQAEMKQESDQAAQPTSPPLSDEFTTPAFEEFPFDSLKMDSSTGGGPEQAQYTEKETGMGNSDEDMSFDTSNFPNFPKFTFPRESGQDDADQTDNLPVPEHSGSDWYKQDQTSSQQAAEPETTRFPMFPGEQESDNSEGMDSGMKEMTKAMESMESDQPKDMFQETMKEEPEMTPPPMTEEMKSGDMDAATENPDVSAITGDGEITAHTGGLPLAPVTENQSPAIPPTGPADNQFENFRESGSAYPDFSVIGFPSFPDIPDRPGNQFYPLSTTEGAVGPSSSVEDTKDNTSSSRLPTEPTPAPPSSREPHLGEFVHPDIFPEVDLSPTAGDEFYARLDSDPTFQTPTAPDLSFSADTRAPLKFPEFRTHFPPIENDFSHARPQFPELRTQFPQPEADFSHKEPETPQMPSPQDEAGDAFESFAEVADLNRDPADDVQVFSDEEKMNDRRAINYHSPTQFGSRSPATYNHFSKGGGSDFKNTFFKNNFNRVTTQRPTTPTPSRVPELERPQHPGHPHGPRYPQGPSRPYPYKPREPEYGPHTTTTTYRPAIFINEGPIAGGDAGQEDNAPSKPSTPKPGRQALFPDRDNIPGYIPRPTRPRPHHRQPAEGYQQQITHFEEPKPQPHRETEPAPKEDQELPGYLPRPTGPASHHRVPQEVFDDHIRPTEVSLPEEEPTIYEVPTTFAPERLTSRTVKREYKPSRFRVNVNDHSLEDQTSASLPEEAYSTAAFETSPPTAATTFETAPPTTTELTNPTTIAELPYTTASTPPPTLPPTTRSATRKPYTFPPFRRRTTSVPAIGSEDATTSQFAPEFGTRITQRKKAKSGGGGDAPKRRPGGRRRPSGGAGSGRGSRRRPGLRRRPAGGRRRTTTGAYTTTTTTPAPAETTTVLPTVATIDEVVDSETEQQTTGIFSYDQREDVAAGPLYEQGVSEDTTEESETVEDSAEPVGEMAEGFGNREMPVDVMPSEEISAAPVPEATPAAEVPAEELIMPQEMLEEMEEHMGPEVITSEYVQPTEVIQQDVEPTQEIVDPVDEIPGDIPEEIFTPGPGLEIVGRPTPLSPQLSEASQSTAEPITERSSVEQAPGAETNGNADIFVPPTSDGADGEAPATPQFPGGIFQLGPDVYQTQQYEEGMMKPRDAAVIPAFDASPLGQVTDVREVTEPSDAPGAVQETSFTNEEVSGPTTVLESRESSVEENGLEDFGVFPEADAGEALDVAAVLREELEDDSVEEVQTSDVDFLGTEAIPIDSFTDDSLQTLDEVPTAANPELGSYSGPSGFVSNEGTLVPSFPYQQEPGFVLAPEEREQDPEMTNVVPSVAVPEAQVPNVEGYGFATPEAAPPHMMDGMSMEENEGQQPEMMNDMPEMVMPETPVPMEGGVLSEMPRDMSQMASSIPEMQNAMDGMLGEVPEMPEVPHMPSEMPDAVNNMPPQMSESGNPMPEFGNSGSPIVMDLAPEGASAASETESGMTAPHSMTPSASGGEPQFSDVIPQGGLMPEMPEPEGALPVSHEDEPTSQDEVTHGSMPFSQDSMEELRYETPDQNGESRILSGIDIPSDAHFMNAPSDERAFIEPVVETREVISEAAEPLHNYSVISDGKVSMTDGVMVPEMTDSTDDSFQEVPSNVYEEPSDPEVDDEVQAAEDDMMTMPEGDDTTSSAGFDIRGSFGDGIETSADEGPNSDAVIADETFEVGAQSMESVPETSLIPDLVAQPTIETLAPAEEFTAIPSESTQNMPEAREADNIGTHFTGQMYYEDQQVLEDDPRVNPENVAAVTPGQFPDVVVEEDDQQLADVDVRIVSEPGSEAALPDDMYSATESDANVVDVVPEEYVPPAEEPVVSDGANMQNILVEEGLTQETQGSPDGDDEEQERHQETSAQEQGSPPEDQELQEQEHQEEAQEEHQGIPQEGQEMQEASQDQTPPSGYGPPHSDTIITDDVTEEEDVTEEDDVSAPSSEADVSQPYEEAPGSGPEQMLL